MRYIDTNLLIRLITNDVPELAQQAIALIEADNPDDIMLFDSVITEICFVLEFNPNYRLSRSLIYNGLLAILDTGKIITEAHTREALNLYVSHPGLDYVDCLLLTASSRKKAKLLTFDKTLLKETS